MDNPFQHSAKGALAKVDLSGNAIGSRYSGDQSGIQALSSALSSSSLKELNIASNFITASDAKLLAPGLQDNGALVNLNVSNNELGPEGAEALVPAM